MAHTACYMVIVVLGAGLISTVRSSSSCRNAGKGDAQNINCDSGRSQKYTRTANEYQEELRCVVVGKTGTGKSSTINTIAGERKFKSAPFGKSVTKKVAFTTFTVEGKKLFMVDTPGLFDTDIPQNETLIELSKVMTVTSPGFHVFLIVIRIGRFTQEEQDAIHLLARKFGPELFERAVVVFTGYDDLIADGVSLEQYIADSGYNLTQLINSCGKRYVGFNNRLQPEDPARMKQVRLLIRYIEYIMKSKHYTYYTNDEYEAIEKMIEEERRLRLARLQAERERERLNQERIRLNEERMREMEEELTEERRKRQTAEDERRVAEEKRLEAERRKADEREITLNIKHEVIRETGFFATVVKGIFKLVRSFFGWFF